MPFPVPSPAPAPNGLKKKTPSQVFGEDSDAYILAVLMRDTLKVNIPTLKEPNLQKWAHDFDVALRNDERMKDPLFVAEVIKWACSDSFWRTNIQSPDKLREQFDKLTAKMEAEAEKLGGNAVIGVDLDYEVLGSNGSMLMVSCTGTAVTV